MKKTAGVLIYRKKSDDLKVLLVNNGKNWSIPKGQLNPKESRKLAAKRELKEEANVCAPKKLSELGTVRKGKTETLHCFAGKHNGKRPRAGKEILSAKFFRISRALKLVESYQAPLLQQLARKVS